MIKPALDTRFGETTVRSRAGLEYEADLILDSEAYLEEPTYKGVSCILVDECQFLSATVVEQLRDITRSHDIPVIAYGLRTDFRTRLFEGSKRLLELADAIEEVKTTCKFCNRKAVFNLRHDSQGRALLEGPAIQLGAEASYSPTCYTCYHERTRSLAEV